jgi:hypothetical protein
MLYIEAVDIRHIKYKRSMRLLKLQCRKFLYRSRTAIRILNLKVGGNEKQCGLGRRQMLGNGLGLWRSRFIFNLNMQFLSEMSYFRFRL